MIHVLDLEFLGFKKAIAAFLVETSAGPVLIETGPHSTLRNLESQVETKGYRISDIKHVLISHIHLDHAGASWALAERGADIYLHPFGAPHMEKPAKLMESARMIYKDQMDRLWGKMNNIPREKLKVIDHMQEVAIGDSKFISIHTPGHAKHHIAWQFEDTIFSGDIAGVKIEDGPVVPPCPPPDINIEDWKESIGKVLERNPSELYLTHFGKITDVKTHLTSLSNILDDWAHWIKSKWESGMTAEEITPQFMAYTSNQLRDNGVDEKGVERYEAANPAWMSVAGLIRYWKKKTA